MSRPQFIRIALALVLAFSAANVLAAVRPPNVLLIVSDAQTTTSLSS